MPSNLDGGRDLGQVMTFYYDEMGFGVVRLVGACGKERRKD